MFSDAKVHSNLSNAYLWESLPKSPLVHLTPKKICTSVLKVGRVVSIMTWGRWPDPTVILDETGISISDTMDTEQEDDPISECS